MLNAADILIAMVRKFLVLVGVFALALGGTMLYLSRPAGSGTAPEGGAGVSFRPARPTGSEVRLGEDDLRGLVRKALEDHENGRRALELAKDLTAEIGEGRIEVGLTINLGELPREELTEKELEALEDLTRYLPFLEDQDLYVGVSGVPEALDGQVSMQRELEVKLAFLSLPMREVGDLFGVDTEPLREKLLLDLSPFKAREVEVLPGEVVIRLAMSE